MLDVDYIFEDVTDERTMSPIGIAYFERSSTAYLQNNVDKAPGVFRIEVQNVIVQKQELVIHQKINNTLQNDPLVRRRLENQTDLFITVDVVVSVVLNRAEDLELNNFFEEFFDLPEHNIELRDMVKLEENIAQELFVKGDISSSNESAKNESPKKSSNGGTVAGSVLGIMALIVGSGLIYLWVQTRRKPNTTSGKLEDIGTISKSFESEDTAIQVSQSLFKREIEYAESTDYSENSVTQGGFRRKSSLTPLMFVPALIPTESNIEVPDTPGTNFAVNGFATPASASGFATPVNASGFMTPSSTRSRGGGSVKLPKLLGDASPDDSVSPVQKPKETPKSITKIPLPPKLLSPLKSPFRREPEAGSQEFDSSSVSRLGVVAGKNNIRPSDKRKKKTEAEIILRDLPMEIGGPSIAPKPTVVPVEEEIVFRQSSGPRATVIPVEDDLIFRKTTSSRKKKKKPPRPWPPPKMESSSNTVVTKASRSRKKKDHSVADIVDEIAYLYSANDPERYTNSSSEI